MSWETDYTTTLPGHDPDTIRSAAISCAELCPRDDLLTALQMLGLAGYERSKPRDAMRPAPDVAYMRRLRESGYSVRQIAEMVGLSPSTIHDHITGRKHKR